MGVVSQESILFNDTIKNNLLIGNENSSEEELLESSKNANAHEFIISQENTFTLVTMKIILPGVTIFISLFENLLTINFL